MNQMSSQVTDNFGTIEIELLLWSFPTHVTISSSSEHSVCTNISSWLIITESRIFSELNSEIWVKKVLGLMHNAYGIYDFHLRPLG